MPITKVDTKKPIRGYIKPNKTQRVDCQTVINALDYADLSRGPGTLHTSGSARIDMQGKTALGASNIQVQIGSKTASTLIISKTALDITDITNQKGMVNAAISVLNQSMDSGTIWNIEGTLP
ncbi:hypothetical protein [Candidatus Enterovibrio escicola]|uniref:hypothetical protein n=1 Tax=Candidatus Enterovibrio escicola TaxID=1927127 RepID=UPI001237C25A|nr:hypothetical protein [Candidatus Enterovibrio escacola]